MGFSARNGLTVLVHAAGNATPRGCGARNVFLCCGGYFWHMRDTGEDTRRVFLGSCGGRVTGIQTARDAAIVAGVKTRGGTDSVSPPVRDNL